MLDNSVTLSVDVANNGTLVPKVYGRYQEFTDRSIYTGPTHTLTSRQTLGFYRTPPKPSSVDLGVAKSAIKLTEDITVLNRAGLDVIRPMIGDVSFSIPVGATVAQTLAFRQAIIAVLDHAIATRLVDQLEI